MTKRYVGVDLGGTNLKLGLVSADGKIVHRSSAATEAERGPDHVLARIAHAVRRLAEGAHLPLTDIAAVGVGAPGPLDSKAGIVVFAPNMAGWRDVPVRDRLQGDLGRPVVLENDANVAAYGEFRCGAARNVSNLALLTLGTGIGGGIVLDGRLFRGSTDTGAELGHMVIQYGGRPCGCGNRGCLEAYASATAVVARAREALR
ncbi:MAG: ROK family protein, partial [Phycisphaerae bacterium]